MNRGAGLLILAAGVVAGACSYGHPAPYRASIPAPPGVAKADLGRFLFLRDCAWCHGQQGQGTPLAPDLVSGTRGPAAVDFVLRTGRMPIARPDERMRRRPPAYLPGQIRALVDYVRTFHPAGPDLPRPRPGVASLHRGAELYLENCAACHSTTAVGGALARGAPERPAQRQRTSSVAPGLTRASPVEVVEAARVGPGTMPVFAPGALSDADLDAIARYVGYLRHPDDRGGFSIGRIGPVAEGAVAWLVGLGMLLAVARRIGERQTKEAEA